MADQLERSAALIEQLLTDPGLRAHFRDDPDGVLSAHGLGALSQRQRALLTLELRESRSSLAGATFAAAVDGLQAAEAAAHAAPGWAHAAAQEISRLIHSSAQHHRAPGARERLTPTEVPPLAGVPPLAEPQAPNAPAPAPPSSANPSAAVWQRPAHQPAAHPPTARHPTPAEHPSRHQAHQDAAADHAATSALDARPNPLAYPGDDASPRALAAWMGAHAVAAGLPPELPVMAALTESGLRNLPYGDRDSVGFFQMRTGIWDRGAYSGYPNHPGLQLRWFIDQALAVRAGRAGAAGFGQDPSGWGEWVADVEQPAAAYRGRYQTQLPAAQALLAGVDFHAAPAPAPIPGPAALRVAERYLGTPYDWGGSSPRTGFDCSGLVQFAFAQVGVHLPRVAADQFHAGIPVARGDLEPGDAVFFANPGGEVHHVGLYIGDGRFINAPESGQDVRIDSLSEPYFASQYAGARRFGPPDAAVRGYARTLPALGG
jgi:cell wall-associated NlpC family hydrolase